MRSKVVNLPGWNSLASAAKIHDWFEIAGIILVILLGFAEGVAYIYGQRKDALTEISEQKQKLPRTLSEKQKQTLIAELTPYQGQKASIQTLMNASDGNTYGNDFREVLKSAHWDFDPGSMQVIVSGADVTGVRIEVNIDQKDDLPPAAIVLAKVLFDLGLIRENALFGSPGVPKDFIEIKIGSNDPSLIRN